MFVVLSIEYALCEPTQTNLRSKSPPQLLYEYYSHLMKMTNGIHNSTFHETRVAVWTRLKANNKRMNSIEFYSFVW